MGEFPTGGWAGVAAASGWWSIDEPDALIQAAESAPRPSPIGSLAFRRAIYSRNGVSWSSVRSWSSRARKDDIAALKTVKASVDPATITAAADEIAEHVLAMVGRPTGWLVTTVAVGHSRRPDSFAVRLAESVAERLGTEFAKMFSDRYVSGVSHPKEFTKLPPLEKLLAADRPVLLVDDVATSGWHLEEALSAIRGDGVPAIATTWISGTVK